MVKVTENKGKSLTLNLIGGKSLRLNARQSTTLTKALAESPEIVRASEKGLIKIELVEDEVKTSVDTKKNKGGKK